MKGILTVAALLCAVFIMTLTYTPAVAAGGTAANPCAVAANPPLTKPEIINKRLKETWTSIDGMTPKEVNEKAKSRANADFLMLHEEGRLNAMSLEELQDEEKARVKKAKDTAAAAKKKVEKEKAKMYEEVKYNTKFFMLHQGAVLTSPYKIDKNPDGTFTLKDNTSTDTNYYMEAYARYRQAFLEEDDCDLFGKWGCLDIDGRLGFVAGQKDAVAATVKGTGNAYVDMSLAYIHPKLINKRKKLGIKASFQPELIFGMVTDKNNQDIHLHYGYGLSVAAGIPKEKNKRIIELLLGGYRGKAELPTFKDNGSSRVLDLEHGYAKFDTQTVLIGKVEFNVPIGKTAYLILHSKYIKKRSGENINPWTVSVGLTVPIKTLLTSVSSLITGEEAETPKEEKDDKDKNKKNGKK